MKKLISGPGFNHLVEARHGYVLYNVNDRYIGRSIEHYGEWSPGETALFGQFCRPGHYVVDVGAHIGTHTLAFARLVGDRRRVFAFEPQRMVAQVLAANVALNSLTNVHTYHLGVGADDGALWLADVDYSREGNFGGVALGAVARPEGDPRPKYRVAVVRLDDFYDQPRLDLIKIDVEGMEADVLRGAGGLIQQHKPVIYAENDRPEKSPELIGLIRSHGYRLFWHRPPLYSPDNFAGSPGTSSIARSCRSTCSASMHRRTFRSTGRRRSRTTPRIPWRRAQFADNITMVGLGCGYGVDDAVTDPDPPRQRSSTCVQRLVVEAGQPSVQLHRHTQQAPVLPRARQFRAGIVWAAAPTQKQNRRRSCRLEDFAPLLELPGTEFVGFQIGPPARELSEGWRGLVHDPGDALDGLEATVDALMEVDLVITVDTMLAHLAGALGRPVWTLLAFAPDMRWMLDRADTPWYPTMRLLRQPAPNDWAGVFREVRRALEAHLARADRPAGMRDQQRDGAPPARRRALAR